MIRKRALARAQRAARMNLSTIVDNYEPEPWDVVKDGRVTVVHAVGIGPADEACTFLNQHNRPHSYEVVPTRGNSQSAED